MKSYKALQAEQEAARLNDPVVIAAAPIWTQRRQHNDAVNARRDIERDIARQNGTLEPTGAKVKRYTLSFLLGVFIRRLF